MLCPNRQLSFTSTIKDSPSAVIFPPFFPTFSLYSYPPTSLVCADYLLFGSQHRPLVRHFFEILLPPLTVSGSLPSPGLSWSFRAIAVLPLFVLDVSQSYYSASQVSSTRRLEVRLFSIHERLHTPADPLGPWLPQVLLSFCKTFARQWPASSESEDEDSSPSHTTTISPCRPAILTTRLLPAPDSPTIFIYCAT